LSTWKRAIQGSEAELVFLAVADVIQPLTKYIL